MKILWISALYPNEEQPQYGIFVKEQANSVASLGVDITILVPISRKVFAGLSEPIVFNNRITIKYFPFDSLVPGAFNLWLAAKQMAELVIKLFHDDIERCDIVHAHETLCAGYIALMINKKMAKPYVVSVHGLDAAFRLNTPLKMLAIMNKRVCAEIYRCADSVIGVSEKTCEKVLSVRTDAKTKIVYNGYNPDLFFPVTKGKSNSFTIICVGNLIPLKRIQDLIKACYKIKLLGYSFKAEIYGRGSLEHYFKDLIKTHDLNNYVFLKGYVSPNEIAHAMQNSSVFVLPSEYEAFGCVYLEAMACGNPIIACTDQGISEIIQDGSEGYLVHTRSPSEIAEKLIQIINNPTILQIMSKKAINTSENYTWLKSAEKIIQIYEEAMV